MEVEEWGVKSACAQADGDTRLTRKRERTSKSL